MLNFNQNMYLRPFSEMGKPKVITQKIFVESSKVEEAVVFYMNAFGAKQGTRIINGDILKPVNVSVDVKIGSLSFNVSDHSRYMNSVKEGMVLWLETEDIEGVVAVPDEGEGEGSSDDARSVGKVKDPYGIIWGFCTPIAMKTADVEA